MAQPHPLCGESLTEQHHKKTCDINKIIARYAKTGLIDHVRKHQGTYGDVSGHDFKTAQDLIAEQKSIFHELPAEVRAEFDNDPANYLDLVMTDEGVEQLADMLNPVPDSDDDDLEPEKEVEPPQKETEIEEIPVT